MASAVYLSTTAVILVNLFSSVQAGIFEQTCNGKIIAMGSGGLIGAPLLHPTQSLAGTPKDFASAVLEFGLLSTTDPSDVSAGVIQAADPAPSSRCAGPPAETTITGSEVLEAMHRIDSKLSLPQPNRLSRKLTDQQIKMREIATDVGIRFAGTPGVQKAKLDTPTFVKLFTTLVHRESGFNPRAVSPVGAKGLGQLMPATARALGVRDSFSPRENLVGAATYLTDMLDKFESPELALAAYNAGPGAVEKYRGIPPYRETRQYVADIFHEVLREPHPQYIVERLPRANRSASADVVVTAYAEQPNTQAASETPFSAILNDTRSSTQLPARDDVVRYAGIREAAILRKSSANEDQGLQTYIAFATEMDQSALPYQIEVNADNLQSSPPDLADLPKPRAFRGELSEMQIANRDLATEIALTQTHSPGVTKAGLSEAAFVTVFVALIRRESSFNDQAISPENAKGLGQLRPRLLNELGVENPFSARENLEASAKYFSALLGEFGSPALALAAYNAGPENVRGQGGIPDDPKVKQFLADVLSDIKKDPIPDYVMMRLGRHPQSTGTRSLDEAKEKANHRATVGNFKTRGKLLAEWSTSSDQGVWGVRRIHHSEFA
jgi:hypothetical protein